MKSIFKNIIQILSYILIYPFIVLANLYSTLVSDNLFKTFGCLLSLIPGLMGSYFRVSFYKGTLKQISTDCYIGFGTFFSNKQAILGKHVNIGAYCIIGNVNIGDKVLIASRVSIMSGKYQHGDAHTKDFSVAQSEAKKIFIGSGTWIGEGAIIADDIGENCIVSFGSIVSRSIPDSYIAVGNPARPIKRDYKT